MRRATSRRWAEARLAGLLVAALATAGGCPQNVVIGIQTGGASAGGGATTGAPLGGASSIGSSTVGASTGGASTVDASSGTTSSSSSGGGCASACSQPTDCAASGTPCLVPTCTAGCCGTVATAAGTPCGDGGALVCDGNGACVPTCSTPADCPAGPCLTATCANGICGASTLVGTTCSDPVPQCCAGKCTDITTDPQSCGACGNHCGLGVCRGSTCVEPITLATEPLNTACAIAVDDTTVYYGTSNTIMKVPKGGGTPVQIVSGGSWAFAIDSTFLYWATDSAIMRTPLVVGSGSTFAIATGLSAPDYLAVMGSSVYWLSATGGTVMKVSTTSGEVTQLATSGVSQPVGLAVSALDVYWTNGGNGTVMAVPIGGGALTQIASSGGVFGIATDATRVYWSDADAGLITSLPIAGGTAVQLTDQASLAHSIAVDATNVYFATTSVVGKVPIGGGTPTILANTGLGGVAFSTGIAVDATSVYWIGWGLHQDLIYKIPK